ncbi:hypothetical protein EVAR_12136_1 [Eumeta japonica]|uniref:Uncharacterized protein n=1 Tax=Eumeta variegata TaxID=151549 RepID=A0A4C1U599_EUMVA|nr:hypothetical protein EVAR_12136_1 [Eumeta japonica]
MPLPMPPSLQQISPETQILINNTQNNITLSTVNRWFVQLSITLIEVTNDNGKTKQLMIGELREQRLYINFPFSNTGVDYAGPAMILNRKAPGQSGRRYRWVDYCAFHLCRTTSSSTTVALNTSIDNSETAPEDAASGAKGEITSNKAAPSSSNKTTSENNASKSYSEYLSLIFGAAFISCLNINSHTTSENTTSSSSSHTASEEAASSSNCNGITKESDVFNEISDATIPNIEIGLGT